MDITTNDDDLDVCIQSNSAIEDDDTKNKK